MATISKQFDQTFKKPNIAAAYGPYPTTAAAHAALVDDELNFIGMTVGIKPAGSSTIEEYWYQGGIALANSPLVMAA